jgi:hypothetical protein
VTKPGPAADPWVRLSTAAIWYAAAVEVEPKHPKREADRLVKAALAYQQTRRVPGRGRKTP